MNFRAHPRASLVLGSALMATGIVYASSALIQTGTTLTDEYLPGLVSYEVPRWGLKVSIYALGTGLLALSTGFRLTRHTLKSQRKPVDTLDSNL